MQTLVILIVWWFLHPLSNPYSYDSLIYAKSLSSVIPSPVPRACTILWVHNILPQHQQTTCCNAVQMGVVKLSADIFTPMLTCSPHFYLSLTITDAYPTPDKLIAKRICFLVDVRSLLIIRNSGDFMVGLWPPCFSKALLLVTAMCPTVSW